MTVVCFFKNVFIEFEKKDLEYYIAFNIVLFMPLIL